MHKSVSLLLGHQLHMSVVMWDASPTTLHALGFKLLPDSKGIQRCGCGEHPEAELSGVGGPSFIEGWVVYSAKLHVWAIQLLWSNVVCS